MSVPHAQAIKNKALHPFRHFRQKKRFEIEKKY